MHSHAFAGENFTHPRLEAFAHRENDHERKKHIAKWETLKPENKLNSLINGARTTNMIERQPQRIIERR